MDLSESVRRIGVEPSLYFRRVVSDDSESRSPLSDHQLGSLFDSTTPGPRIVVACSAVWGTEVTPALVRLAAGWESSGTFFDAVLLKGAVAEFRDLIERAGSSARPSVVVVPQKAGWTNEWVEWCRTNKSVKSGRVLPVFVADGGWLRAAGVSDPVSDIGHVFIPKPWGDQMLRAYLAESDGWIFDHASRREMLLAGSGGSPALLAAGIPKLADACRVSGANADEVLASWRDKQRISLASVGLEASFAPLVALLGDLEADDIGELSELMRLEDPNLDSDERIHARLRLFQDVGLIEIGDLHRVGLRVTTLGKLVKASLPAK